MHTEYEVRILEINKEEIIKKLESLGATKLGDWDQKRYVYDLNPKHEGKWIRLRTNGETTTLTYKFVEKDTIDGTKEIEIIVDDFKKTDELLNAIGFYHRGYQENKRIRYQLDGVEIDIDTWPMIPTYLELEANFEEEINNMIKKLGLEHAKITTLSPQDIYLEVYEIDITKMEVIKF